MPEIRIDYFLKKVDNVIKTFEKDTIDYFETGFKFLEGMDEKEFKRQLQNHIDNYFSQTVEENGQKVMEILHQHVELNQKDQEAIFNLLKSLPLEKPRLNLLAIAAIVWYVFKKYMKKEKIKQKDVAKIFGISQAVFSKWFGDFKELLLNKEV
ncbi:hypothetical protein [Caldicellulosiruptor bescii]|nr:hypothetical protein [Caldicellulosiruptor bescii]